MLRLFLGVVPLLLTILFAWLVMEGHLSFGGGEKEIFLAIPLVIWSLVYWPRPGRLSQALSHPRIRSPVAAKSAIRG